MLFDLFNEPHGMSWAVWRNGGEVTVKKKPGEEDAVTWVPEMIGFIQKHKLRWTAFAFHPKAGPSMLEDWNCTPNATWDAPVKRALAGESFELKKLR